MNTHLVRFLRREDAGTNRLSDFLHIISELLLLQSLICFAFAWIVLDRLLQTARIACVDIGTTFNCFRTFSLSYNYFFLSGSVNNGRGYDFCQFDLYYFFSSVRERLSDASSSHLIKRAVIRYCANSAYTPDQEHISYFENYALSLKKIYKKNVSKIFCSSL